MQSIPWPHRENTIVTRLRKFLGKVSLLLCGAGFAMLFLWACAAGVWGSGLLALTGAGLFVLGMLGSYLWLLIWVFTLLVRFGGWLFEEKGARLGRRVGGFFLVACVVIPAAIGL